MHMAGVNDNQQNQHMWASLSTQFHGGIRKAASALMASLRHTQSWPCPKPCAIDSTLLDSDRERLAQSLLEQSTQDILNIGVPMETIPPPSTLSAIGCVPPYGADDCGALHAFANSRARPVTLGFTKLESNGSGLPTPMWTELHDYMRDRKLEFSNFYTMMEASEAVHKPLQHKSERQLPAACKKMLLQDADAMSLGECDHYVRMDHWGQVMLTHRWLVRGSAKHVAMGHWLMVSTGLDASRVDVAATYRAFATAVDNAGTDRNVQLVLNKDCRGPWLIANTEFTRTLLKRVADSLLLRHDRLLNKERLWHHRKRALEDTADGAQATCLLLSRDPTTRAHVRFVDTVLRESQSVLPG